VCSDGKFLGIDGATSLKAEICARVPRIDDSSTFREARHLLQQLGGALALREELTFAGFVDPVTDTLTLGDKPFNIFAQLGSSTLVQEALREEQKALGKFQEKFVVCANRPENDRHWDSIDPKWTSFASMARRHRFLTTKDLHWQWFNPIVMGMVPASDGGVDPRRALAEVEEMKAACLHFAQNVGGWSTQIGLFVNIFGHNNVNSLFIHILDMSELGPGFSFHAFKNCPLDSVLKVLREEAASNLVASPASQPTLKAYQVRAAVRRKSVLAGKVPFFFAGTDGATSVKAELVGRVPVMKDASSYREARRLLTEELGGVKILKEELVRMGFVEEDTGELTTGTNPFNIFARIIAGKVVQPGMEHEQTHLGEYQESFMICCNRPECDEHWDSEEAEWVGKASMSRRHRFLIKKDLHWQWFNAIAFGLVPTSDGGVSIEEALVEVERMKAAALMYASRVGGWSDKIGLFFHVFGHNTVNSMHMHILDMTALGPTFWKYEYKNCPVDHILKVLREEVNTAKGSSQLAQATEAAALAAQAASNAAKAIISSGFHQPTASTPAEILALNIGGENMSIPRATLLLAPEGSLLHSMFGPSWADAAKQELDNQGRVFLNFPPKAFKVIADHMRMLHLAPSSEIVDPPMIPRESRKEILDLAWLLGVEGFLLQPQWGRGPHLRSLSRRPTKAWWSCVRRRPAPLPRSNMDADICTGDNAQV